MAGQHVCLLCGAAIEPTDVDPLTAVITAAPSADERSAERPRGARRPATTWWRRPPGQYWLHAACLRQAAHPTVPLPFLDVAESGAPD
ncbi:MAG: hypothetical protein R2726_23235 [Acidimicrobiales bacterium]